MYTKLGISTLKNGEEAELGVVTGPDAFWAPRLTPFLSHKGAEWVSQIRQTLEQDLSPLTSKYFILFKTPDDVMSNVSTFVNSGVGLLGHVYTTPQHRRKGAASVLMQASLDDFGAQHGRAMYLGTGYDTPPYHIYEGFGFKSVYPGTGFMEWYSGDRETFLAEEFAGEKCDVVEASWRHWPMLIALIGQEEGGILRLPGEGANGRANFEGDFVRLRHAAEQSAKRVFVLEGTKTGVTGGIAVIGPDRRFGGGVFHLDLFFHPNFEKQAAALASKALECAPCPVLSYADTTFEKRIAVLRKIGFKKKGVVKSAMTASAGLPNEGSKHDLIILAKG